MQQRGASATSAACPYSSRPAPTRGRSAKAQRAIDRALDVPRAYRPHRRRGSREKSNHPEPGRFREKPSASKRRAGPARVSANLIAPRGRSRRDQLGQRAAGWYAPARSARAARRARGPTSKARRDGSARAETPRERWRRSRLGRVGKWAGEDLPAPSPSPPARTRTAGRDQTRQFRPKNRRSVHDASGSELNGALRVTVVDQT